MNAADLHGSMPADSAMQLRPVSIRSRLLLASLVAGAVGMVEMALAELQKNNIVQLDEERKAAMVSNLLVVLCSDRATQPIVNTGSLY